MISNLVISSYYNFFFIQLLDVTIISMFTSKKLSYSKKFTAYLPTVPKDQQ